MKTKKELNEIKEELQAITKELSELTDDELKEAAGGFSISQMAEFNKKNPSYTDVSNSTEGYRKIEIE